MRRYARTLILIAALAALAGVILGIQKIEIGGVQRGEDTLLGLSLGLELQGGSHLVYQAIDGDTGEPIVPESTQMDALKRSIERRVNASGLGEPIIQRLGDDRLLIQLPGVRDPERAKALIGETAQLVFRHRKIDVPRDLDEFSDEDIVSVTVATLPLGGEEPQAETEAATTTSSTEGEAQEVDEGPPFVIVEFTAQGAEGFEVVLDRLEETLIAITAAREDGSTVPPNRLDISLEGAEPRRFQLTSFSISQVGTSTRYAFPIPANTPAGVVTDLEEARAILGDNPVVRFSEIQGAVDLDIGLTGDNLARAFPGQHQASGAPIINIEFDSEGTKIFGELTQRIAGTTDQIAIFLDEEELIAPVVTTVITSGAAFIQGRDFTIDEVRDKALLLESGRLPLPIELIQERDVDAILGADSLKKSVVAGGVGLALVLLFMTLYYRVPGLVASLALIIYSAMVLATFKMVPITLTLSGIAAVILSVGMAVDGNVLIFERMKEELRAGRTLLSAINIGFNRAWPAIRDGNVSTLITCGILFWFSDQLGTTIVQGFAAALAIGVMFSMFSAIVVSRTLLRVLATTRLTRNLGMFVPTGASELPQHTRAAAPAD